MVSPSGAGVFAARERALAGIAASIARVLLVGAVVQGCNWSVPRPPPPPDATMPDGAMDGMVDDLAAEDARPDAPVLDATDARADAADGGGDASDGGPVPNRRCYDRDSDGGTCPNRGVLEPEVRVAQFAVGITGSVDFCFKLVGESDGAFRGPFMINVLRAPGGVGFGDVSAYRTVIGTASAEQLVARVVRAGATSCATRFTGIDRDYTLPAMEPGESMTVALVGEGDVVGGAHPLEVAAWYDTRITDPSAFPSFRIINAAPSLGAVDLVIRHFPLLPDWAPAWVNVTYLVPGGVNPAVIGRVSGDCNCYTRMPLAGTSVTVTVAPTGTMTELVTPTMIQLIAGELRTGFGIGRRGVTSGTERLQMRFCPDAVTALPRGAFSDCQIIPM